MGISTCEVKAQSNFVMAIQRPAYKDLEIMMLKGDVYHFRENDLSTVQFREATEQETNDEMESRAHRAEMKGEKEMRRI